MGLGLALGAGALLGGLGSKGGTQTTTTRIPDWLKDYVTGSDTTTGILPQAQSIYNSMPQGLNADQLVAQGMIRDTASSPYGTNALNFMNKTIQGDYLGGGEYMRAYGNDVMDRVNTQFAQAGRTGSGYHAKAAAEGLGNVTARMYDQERGRQMQVASMIPQLQAGQYQAANALNSAATMDQNQQWNNLNQYANLVYGAPHGNTQSTPMKGNMAGGILGGALTGLSLYNGGAQAGLWGK